MNRELNTLIIDLSRAIGQRRLYFSDHPLIRNYAVEIIDNLRLLLTRLESKELFIGIIEGKLVHDGHYLVGPSIMGQQLVKFCHKLQCGGLILGQKSTIIEVQQLLDLAAELKGQVADLQEARELLAGRGVVNIKLAPHFTAASGLIPTEDKVIWQGQDGGGHLHSPLLVYQAIFDVVAMAHANVNLDRAIDISGAQSVSAHLLNSARSNFTDMLQFVRYPDHDSYTVGHSVRVATLAVFVADQLGLSDKQLLELGTAALLHDVGKSKISTDILFKPGRLSKEEFGVMRGHARLGAEILLEHQESTRIQVAAAWGHHLRYDGGGYPTAPRWAMRSHLVALLHICDVFEALTAVRPYKARLSPLAAYGIRINDRGAFDPALLHAFISTLGIYPPGNRVRLADGHEAVVISTGVEVDQPVVRLTKSPSGEPMPPAVQQIVDLGKKANTSRQVTELLFGEAT